MMRTKRTYYRYAGSRLLQSVLHKNKPSDSSWARCDETRCLHSNHTLIIIPKAKWWSYWGKGTFSRDAYVAQNYKRKQDLSGNENSALALAPIQGPGPGQSPYPFWTREVTGHAHCYKQNRETRLLKETSVVQHDFHSVTKAIIDT